MVNLSFYYERKTKMKINIIPLEKIEIDGKSIELGMKREQVIGILGLGKLMTAKMDIRIASLKPVSEYIEHQLRKVFNGTLMR